MDQTLLSAILLPTLKWVFIVLAASLASILVFLMLAVILRQETLFRSVGTFLCRIVYRVKVLNDDKLPTDGFLLLPNHVTYVDALILQLACPRPIRFVVVERIFNQPLLKPVFKLVGAIPIAPTRAKDAIRQAAECIRNGEIVCVFPEGELTRTGSLLKLRKGFELIARKADAPVLPVWLDELWGSVFSYDGGRFFTKCPKRIPYKVTAVFGTPIPNEQADIGTVREQLLELGEIAYQQRPHLRQHLAEPCVRGLRRNQFRIAITDGLDDSQIKGGTLLAASIALSRYLRGNCPHKRVAIVLPPGKGAAVANLGVLLAGKVPVNLNFTAGRAALQSSIDRGLLADAITARKMEAKLGPDFPWPENKLYLEKILPNLKPKIVLWRALVLLLPSWALLRLIGIPKTGDREEATLLFTSGSSGEPKGVVLSHRNLIGNIGQFGVMLTMGKDDCILATLPIFHSFGCTVTLWYALIEGIHAVSYPSPLETVKNAELIEKHNVTLLCTTPTFLRGYMRRSTPEQLAPLRLIVTGAEKLPDKLALDFEKRFNHPVMQGYGLTETAPMVSVNLPNPTTSEPGMAIQDANRLGSAGRLAPGLAAQIRDPDTGAHLALHETGMLWLKGPNIFEGYLDQPEQTREVLKEDGWFMTGDLGRFDEDGFLYIEGRLSRFSKIGGEMVPHETVEANILEVLDVPDTGDRVIAIAGIPDESKGEALVLLTTVDIDPKEMRTKLLALSLPSLFIPKIIRKVDALPLLASGKLDLRGLKDMAAAGQD